MEKLLLALLPMLIQYGPQLVKDVVDLVHGNPQQQGESDEAYIARLNDLTNQNILSTLSQDKQVEEG